MKQGKLLVLPTALGPEGDYVLPGYLLREVQRLRYFVAERAKTARHFLKACDMPVPIPEIRIEELNKRTPPEDLPLLLAPILEEKADMGLLSEAGCPAVADPGAELIRMAHQLGIPVKPFVGPSSILLALMASGLNGQHFCFHGYLSPKRPQLAQELRKLEQGSGRDKQTQIFMETPYRNNALVEEALQTLQAGTLFCIAADLTLPSEYICTKTVGQWQQSAPPDLHKRPAIFLMLGQ